MQSNSFSILEHKKCRVVSKKTYTDNELIYSIEYSWKGNRVTKTKSNFFGKLRDAFNISESVTSFDYLKTDKKGNWTERMIYRDDDIKLERRTIQYY